MWRDGKEWYAGQVEVRLRRTAADKVGGLMTMKLTEFSPMDYLFLWRRTWNPCWEEKEERGSEEHENMWNGHCGWWKRSWWGKRNTVIRTTWTWGNGHEETLIWAPGSCASVTVSSLGTRSEYTDLWTDLTHWDKVIPGRQNTRSQEKKNYQKKIYQMTIISLNKFEWMNLHAHLFLLTFMY